MASNSFGHLAGQSDVLFDALRFALLFNKSFFYWFELCRTSWSQHLLDDIQNRNIRWPKNNENEHWRSHHYGVIRAFRNPRLSPRSLPRCGQRVCSGWRPKQAAVTRWRLEIVIDEKKIVSTCVGAIRNALIWSRHRHSLATMAAARQNSSRVKRRANYPIICIRDAATSNSAIQNHLIIIYTLIVWRLAASMKRFAQHYFNEEQDQKRTSNSDRETADDATVRHLWIGGSSSGRR